MERSTNASYHSEHTKVVSHKHKVKRGRPCQSLLLASADLPLLIAPRQWTGELPRQSASRTEITRLSRRKACHTNQERQVCWRKSGQRKAAGPGRATHPTEQTTQKRGNPDGQASIISYHQVLLKSPVELFFFFSPSTHKQRTSKTCSTTSFSPTVFSIASASMLTVNTKHSSCRERFVTARAFSFLFRFTGISKKKNNNNMIKFNIFGHSFQTHILQIHYTK